MRFYHPNFIRHKTDEIPYTYKSTGKIIFPLFQPNSFLNNKLEKMTLERKVAGVG
jgi:hypothetical protein